MYDHGWCAVLAILMITYVAGAWFLSIITMGRFVLGLEHAFAFTAGIVCLAVALDQERIGCMQTDGVTQKEPKEIREFQVKNKCE